MSDSAVCNICKQIIAQGIEIKSLQCCICNNSYHGECLKINDALLPHLHVVADVGGWCCTQCRTMKKVAARKVTKPAAADPAPVITEFRKDLEVIKTQMSTISARLQAFPPLPPPAAGPTLFANSIVQPSTKKVGFVLVCLWRSQLRTRDSKRIRIHNHCPNFVTQPKT